MIGRRHRSILSRSTRKRYRSDGRGKLEGNGSFGAIAIHSNRCLEFFPWMNQTFLF